MFQFICCYMVHYININPVGGGGGGGGGRVRARGGDLMPETIPLWGF